MNDEESIMGAFYLHTNGEMIWKNANVFLSDSEYFDSPFVKKVWYIHKDTPKADIVQMVKEANPLGANRKSIIEICKDICIPKSLFLEIIGEEK